MPKVYLYNTQSMQFPTEISLIRFLSQHPEIYSNNIFCLRAVLNGFWYRQPYIRENTLENRYQNWVEVEFVGGMSALSWAEILFLYTGNHAKAIQLFFESIEKLYAETVNEEIVLMKDDRFAANNSIMETLQAIRNKILLYISKPEIICLSAFINGWLLRDGSNVVDRELFERFQSYIVQMYNPLKHGQGTHWETCIYVYGQPNCIQTFYACLDS